MLILQITCQLKAEIGFGGPSYLSDVTVVQKCPVCFLFYVTLKLNTGRNFILRLPHDLFMMYAQSKMLDLMA
jgi:hypothetical protein